jgi:hypothetical protein
MRQDKKAAGLDRSGLGRSHKRRFGIASAFKRAQSANRRTLDRWRSRANPALRRRTFGDTPGRGFRLQLNCRRGLAAREPHSADRVNRHIRSRRKRLRAKSTNSRRFMCGWPPPGKRKCSVPHRSRLQSCVRPHMMVSPSRADLGRSRSKVGLSFSAGLPLQTSHPAGVDPSHCPAFGTGRAPRERHHSV